MYCNAAALQMHNAIIAARGVCFKMLRSRKPSDGQKLKRRGKIKRLQAKEAKRQAETEEEREVRRLQDAQAKETKRKSASVKQKEAKAKIAKQQAEQYSHYIIELITIYYSFQNIIFIYSVAILDT
jgi:glucan-binding YG repeat protein